MFDPSPSACAHAAEGLLRLDRLYIEYDVIARYKLTRLCSLRKYC